MSFVQRMWKPLSERINEGRKERKKKEKKIEK